MKKIYPCLLTIFLLVCANAWTQQKYWIYFNTQVEKRLDAQVEGIKQYGIEPIVVSHWLSAASAYLDADQKKTLLHLKEVDRIQHISRKLRVLGSALTDSIQLDRALDQINANAIVDSGLTGKGVKIGVIDGGFYHANKDGALAQIIDNQQVKGYKNYIETGITDPYSGPRKNNDHHGTIVWTAIAGRLDKRIKGLASNATFYLARTDQADKEYRGEEDYWVAALEWMHSQGVRLVNSSVGYSNGYDDPAEDYHPLDVDGESSAITQAARVASEDKGMLIVVSAGNDGNNVFQVISLPGDAKGVLTVGATNYYDWSKAGYSSIGPSKLPHVKPDVSCYASSGTSFSAPIMTGLAACIMEADPGLTNVEIIDLITRSAHLYEHPNNYIGYGVPDAEKIIADLSTGHIEKTAALKIMTSSSTVSLDLDRQNVVAFHKLDDITVLSQQRLPVVKGKVTVVRQEGVAVTTVATPGKTWEIHWIE